MTHIPDEAVQAFCENFYGWYNLPETTEFERMTAKAEVERALNLALPFFTSIKLHHRLERTIDSYRKMKPEAVASGSYAQILYALQDARKDILTLSASISSEPA